MTKILGRLERVELREIWGNESSDFTPWLAREENLKLLGDTLGIELELQGSEQFVGPFRADILCKDTASGALVLIENQLERTDHTHLGQLMTYAAGLNVATIVWVASNFTDEHRAALDWLNEITNENFDFFGLEIEAWKIGDSLAAPKLNIVSQPNDWKRTFGGGSPESRGLTDTQKLQLAFWTAFREHVQQQKGPIKAQKPFPQHWMNIAVGRANCWLAGVVNTQDKTIGVELSVSGPMKPLYYGLLAEKAEIEKALGAIEWMELQGKKVSRLRLSYQADILRQEEWPQQHKWMFDTLNAFHSYLSSKLRSMKPEDYSPQPIQENE